jgi:phosphatidate cytidylyltransferase
VQLNKIIPLFCVQFYSLIALLSYYRLETEVFLSDNFGLNTRLDVDIKLLNTTLLITLLSIKCIIFLFDDNVQYYKSVKVPLPSRIYCFTLYFANIIWNKDYNQKIIIGLFIIIWTNDTFAYIVGKSIGKINYLNEFLKKNNRRIYREVAFAVFAGYLISKLYIRQSNLSPNQLQYGQQ